MRVALPGVQVLFAFLLTVPFQQRFGTVGSFGRATYMIALLLATLSSGLLIGPGAYHRVRFGQHDLLHTVAISHRMALAGLACLALAIPSAVMTACSLLASSGVAAAIGAGVLAILTTIWFILPLARGIHERRHSAAA